MSNIVDFTRYRQSPARLTNAARDGIRAASDTYLESRDGRLFIVNDCMGVYREIATFIDDEARDIFFKCLCDAWNERHPLDTADDTLI
jgi:hypothetical protein